MATPPVLLTLTFATLSSNAPRSAIVSVMAAVTKLFIVGLGNHQTAYAQTRHNIGKQIVSSLVRWLQEPESIQITHLDTNNSSINSSINTHTSIAKAPTPNWSQTRLYYHHRLSIQDLDRLRNLRQELNAKPTNSQYKRLPRSATYRSDQTEVYLISPRTYMNTIGGVVAQVFKDFESPVKPKSQLPLLLVHDDLDTTMSASRFKVGGSPNGHNGVRSTAHSLQSDLFERLRVGIGRPLDKLDVPDFVLEPWTPLEDAMLTACAKRYYVELLEWIESWPRS